MPRYDLMKEEDAVRAAQELAEAEGSVVERERKRLLRLGVDVDAKAEGPETKKGAKAPKGDS